MNHLNVQLCLSKIEPKLKLSRSEIIDILIKYAEGNLKSILSDLKIKYIGPLNRYYSGISKIGLGGYGKVFKVTDRENFKEYALKMINPRHNINILLEEVSILEDLSKSPECNKYIVCVYDLFSADYKEKRHIFIKMELIEGHELYDLLDCSEEIGEKIPDYLIRFIAHSILKG